MTVAIASQKAKDVRNVPLYSVGEAAHYIPGLNASTLRTWVQGRSYPTQQGSRFAEPLICRPKAEDGRISFLNLIEAFVLHALRTQHEIRMSSIRSALDYAEAQCGIERLLLHKELMAGPGDLFLERYGHLVNLSKAGQLAIKAVLRSALQRIERDRAGFPVRLFPSPLYFEGFDKEFAIDPSISFGRPVIVKRGIRVSALADRVDSGETVETVAADYELEPEEVERAIAYALAA